jgi:hypothetical protein
MTSTSVITPDTIDALIHVFKTRFGNCNLLFSFLLGKSISINLFGGIIRDYFRGFISNDIDIWMQFSDQFCTIYDTKTRTFRDLLFEKLQDIFSGCIIKTSTSEEVIKTDTKVWNKNKYIESGNEEDLVDLDSCNAANPDYDAYKIHNDHVEYQFTFKDEPVKLDITFCKDTEDKTAWNSPACLEDSLYLELNPDKLASIDFSSDPHVVLDQICAHINTNTYSFALGSPDISTIISNCSLNIITVLDIDCFKRVMKIVRFHEEGCTLSISDGDDEKFMKLLKQHSDDYTKDPTDREKIIKLLKLGNITAINDNNSVGTKVVQKISEPDDEGWQTVETTVKHWKS